MYRIELDRKQENYFNFLYFFHNVYYELSRQFVDCQIHEKAEEQFLDQMQDRLFDPLRDQITKEIDIQLEEDQHV